MEIQKENLGTWTLYGVWIVSLSAILGSLYFSEIAHLTPCVLCWYQRICVYPLFLTSSVAILIKDQRAHFYILPPAVIGFFVAVYHYLLQSKIIPESLAPCQTGVSCITIYRTWFGFVTIPLLSACAFLLIILLMLFYRRLQK